MHREPSKEFHFELYDKIWKTKGNRFSAYERLRQTNILSTSTTSFLAAYLIILSLLEPFNIITICNLSKNIISFTSVALSIIILVFVQLESANNYSLRAEKFLECAKELAKLFNRLEIEMNSGTIDRDVIDQISTDYSKIIEKYENHIPIDYELHKANCAKDFGISRFNALWIKFKVKTIINSKYHLMMALPPIAFILLILTST